MSQDGHTWKYAFLAGVSLPSVLLAPLFWHLTHTEEALRENLSLGLTIAAIALAVAGLLYGAWLLIQKKSVPKPVWITVSVLYSSWLMLTISGLFEGFSKITTLPWLPACLLAMLPSFVSMWHIIRWTIPQDKAFSAGKGLLPLLAVPVIWYLLVNTIRYAYFDSLPTVILILAAATTYGFVFIMLRTLCLLARSKDAFRKYTRYVILFVLPLLGLLVTQFAPDFSFFWDFSSPLYYLLVIANGILLLLPEPQKQWPRLALFFGRCCGWLFVTYFFVVISPFYTLSLLGVLLFGLGLLVLSPLFLWIYETKILWESGKALFQSCGALKTIFAGALGALLIPVCLVMTFYSDRINMNAAASYLSGAESIAGADAGAVDGQRFQKSLRYMQSDGGLRFNYENPHQERALPPLITQLYNRVVDQEKAFGSAASLSRAHMLFLNETSWEYGWPYSESMENTSHVTLENIDVETVQQGDFYKSTVHLTLQNDSIPEQIEGDKDEVDAPYDFYDDLDNQEYRTSFRLPEGVFVSDYYLDVAGERRRGLLAERSSALWIYNEVVWRSLDPGLVYYDGDDIALHVFPFAEGEERYTGIELIHKGPVTFAIDGQTVQLAPEAPDSPHPVTSNGAIYFSAAAKENLPPAVRQPRYEFVVDCSEDSDVLHLTGLLRDFCDINQISSQNVTIHALNYRRAVFHMDDPAWERSLLQFQTEGGFSLGLTADAICRGNEDSDTYPVMIVLTDDIGGTIWPSDMSYLAARSPELDGYYLLNADGLYLCPFDIKQAPESLDGLLPAKAMLKAEIDGATYYLRDDNQPRIIPGNRMEAPPAQADEDIWMNALRLMGDSRLLPVTPVAERQEAQIALIRNSFDAGVMTPLTSFIVLETKEQEKAMLDRQQKLLESGDIERSVEADYSDDAPVTSEPPLLLCAVLLILVMTLGRQKERRKNNR